MSGDAFVQVLMALAVHTTWKDSKGVKTYRRNGRQPRSVFGKHVKDTILNKMKTIREEFRGVGVLAERGESKQRRNNFFKMLI